MRIVVLSDTHNQHLQVPDIPHCDILIHAGDFSGTGEKEEIESFLRWFSRQVFATKKIMIAGNHSRSFDPKFEKQTFAKTWLLQLMSQYPNIHYLENTWIELFGLKIWGSPITPWFFGEYWAFNRLRGENIMETWKTIPFDTDIVITHGPPQYILDRTPQGDFVGCKDLRKIIEEIKPKLHIFGHIHIDKRGIRERSEVIGNTTFINTSLLNNSYHMINKPILIELDKNNQVTSIVEI